MAAISIFICLLGCTAVKDNTRVMTVPGTGITLKQPPGIELAPAGAILLGEAGEIIINIAVSDSDQGRETEAAWRSAFKHDPEKISTRTLSADLYHRTRAADGGDWDGWLLRVARGKKVLNVTAMYTGKQSDVFETLPTYFKTIVWDEKLVDPEVALGLSIKPKGFQLQKDFSGSLSFRAADASEFLVQPMPVSKAQSTLDKFKLFCDSMKQTLTAKLVSGPYFVERQGIHTCEIWNRSDEPEMHYIALIRLPNGGVFNAMGVANKNRFKSSLPIFRAAIREAKLLSRSE